MADVFKTLYKIISIKKCDSIFLNYDELVNIYDQYETYKKENNEKLDNLNIDFSYHIFNKACYDSDISIIENIYEFCKLKNPKFSAAQYMSHFDYGVLLFTCLTKREHVKVLVWLEYKIYYIEKSQINWCITNYIGQTFFEILCYHGELNMLKFLIEKICDVYTDTNNMVDRDYSNIDIKFRIICGYMILVETSHVMCAEWLFNEMLIRNIISGYPYKYCYIDKSDKSVIFVDIINCSYDIMIWLISCFSENKVKMHDFLLLLLENICREHVENKYTKNPDDRINMIKKIFDEIFVFKDFFTITLSKYLYDYEKAFDCGDLFKIAYNKQLNIDWKKIKNISNFHMRKSLKYFLNHTKQYFITQYDLITIFINCIKNKIYSDVILEIIDFWKSNILFEEQIQFLIKQLAILNINKYFENFMFVNTNFIKLYEFLENNNINIELSPTMFLDNSCEDLKLLVVCKFCVSIGKEILFLIAKLDTKYENLYNHVCTCRFLESAKYLCDVNNSFQYTYDKVRDRIISANIPYVDPETNERKIYDIKYELIERKIKEFSEPETLKSV